MKFSDIVNQASTLLQDTGRITYRALKREFDLDEDALNDLTFELIEGQEVAADKDGKMLVWIGGETSEDAASPRVSAISPHSSLCFFSVFRRIIPATIDGAYAHDTSDY